tara:strand:+ start:1098 stop:1355 length:258 start_codon:yes stop_codon:yes gene_type:complete
MNTIIIGLGLALVASTNAFTSASAEDAFQIAPSTSQPQFVAGVVPDLDASKGIEEQRGTIEYTATASVAGSPHAKQNRKVHYRHY